MKEIVKNVLKSAAIWAVVGALFALAAPSLAVALDIPVASVGIIADPKWLAPFLGLTAGVATALDPLFSFVFGAGKSAGDKEYTAKEKSEAKQVNLTIVQSPQQSQGQAADTTHRDRLEGKRVAILLTGAHPHTPGV